MEKNPDDIIRDIAKVGSQTHRSEEPLQNSAENYRTVLNWKDEKTEGVEIIDSEINAEEAEGFMEGP